MCTFCFCWKETTALVGQLINEFFRQLSSEELEVDDDGSFVSQPPKHQQQQQ
jgi:hypothetical protein